MGGDPRDAHACPARPRNLHQATTAWPGPRASSVRTAAPIVTIPCKRHVRRLVLCTCGHPCNPTRYIHGVVRGGLPPRGQAAHAAGRFRVRNRMLGFGAFEHEQRTLGWNLERQPSEIAKLSQNLHYWGFRQQPAVCPDLDYQYCIFCKVSGSQGPEKAVCKAPLAVFPSISQKEFYRFSRQLLDQFRRSESCFRTLSINQSFSLWSFWATFSHWP